MTIYLGSVTSILSVINDTKCLGKHHKQWTETPPDFNIDTVCTVLQLK